MSSASFRFLNLFEVFGLFACVALYIWWLQTSHPASWVVFPIWLLLSFFFHHDTPKTIGWRSDNLLSATRRAALVFAILIAVICITGFFLGGLHRLPLHLLNPRRLGSYIAFCLLQQVALQSLVMNRLLAAFPDYRAAALVAGIFFAALHWPNPVLVPLTLIGGTAMCWLFARERNILPLAFGQAILGTLVWWAFPLAWHHSMKVGPGYYSFHP